MSDERCPGRCVGARSSVNAAHDPSDHCGASCLTRVGGLPMYLCRERTLPNGDVVVTVVALCGLAVWTSALRDSVLCRGGDGHVSVERAVGGQCDPGTGVEGRPALRSRHPLQDGCCGPCSDFALPGATLVASSSAASTSTYHSTTPGFASPPNLLTISVPLASRVLRTLPPSPGGFLRPASIRVLRC